MLVYLKNPMGYSSIGDKRVYGKQYAYGSMGPTDIAPSDFRKYSDILCEANYTKSFLSSKFGVDFPDVTFRLSDLSNMHESMLIKLALCVGINYIKTRNISSTEKRALIKSIRRKIS